MKKIYIVSDHKTGTVWAANIFRRFCTNSNYLFIEKAFPGIKGNIFQAIKFLKYENNKIKFIYSYFTKNRIYFFNRADIKINSKKHKKVLFIRDPRDMCISAANYDGKDWNQDPKTKKFESYKQEVENKEYKDLLEFQATKIQKQTLDRLLKFDKKYKPVIIKYEDFFLDNKNNNIELNNLCDYLDFNDEEKEKMLFLYKFTHLESGIPNSHVVSGEVEQYQSLDKPVKNLLNLILADYILYFKYNV
jgi:hypothetical protein